MFAEARGGRVPGLISTLPPPASSTTTTSSSSSSNAAAAPRQLPFASLSFSLAPPAAAFAFGAGTRRAAPFARIASSSSSLFGAARQEPATGIAYPQELCVLTKGHCPKLAGVGVRAKRILGLKNINVYAVGLYVDGPGAKKALHKFKGASVDGLMANQQAFDDLVDSTHFEKSLRLVISFGSLKRGQFVSALEERLKPALDKAKEPPATLKAFERLFDSVDFRKGLEIDFASHHKGQLVTQVDGKQVGSIQSPALVKALFDVYVGHDPVSADAKRAISKGLADLLNE